MSNNAAIAAVTATLTNMIQAAVSADPVVSSGTVTARPPDEARQGAPVNQVNLFLYRTSIDAAWRNQDPPSIRPGEIGAAATAAGAVLPDHGLRRERR